MRIAITGSQGKVGQAVVAAALARQHTVVAIDRPGLRPPAEPNVTFHGVDVTLHADFAHAVDGCDALVHLAAFPSPINRPDHEVHNNNVTGSYNALSIAASFGITHVVLASSINAIGGVFSRQPRYDYFPVDERHPTYNEDPYSLSKWICEIQADSFARRHEFMTISTLRLHGVSHGHKVETGVSPAQWRNSVKHLWGYTTSDAAADACLRAATASFTGHEVFYIVAPTTTVDTPSLELRAEYYPDVAVTGDLGDTRSFFDCGKAYRMLGWKHDRPTS
jgi:nucleoside-diphosphate-sugar epimerase